MAIEKFEKDMKIITPLDDYPNDAQGLTSEELKAKFDEGGEALKEYINTVLLPALIARNLGFERSDNVPADTIQEAIENLFNQIRNTAVGTIPNGAVTTEKISNASVTMAKLADDVMLTLNNYGLNIVENADDIDALIISLAQLSLAVERHIETANGYFSGHDTRISRSEEDFYNVGYANAQAALAAERKGEPLLWHDENVMFNLLTGRTAVGSFTDLYINDGAGLTPFSGDLKSTQGGIVTNSVNYAKICSFSNIPGFGSISQLRIGVLNHRSDAMKLELRQAGEVIATCEFLETDGNQGNVYYDLYTVNGCPRLDPYSQNPVEVWAVMMSTSADDSNVSDSSTAKFVASTPTAGEFTKSHGAVNGSKMVLVAKYKGTRPVVSYRLANGDWQTMTAIKSITTKTHDGASCSAASFESVFAEYAEGEQITLKFELINAGTKVYDYCAAVVR